MVVEGQNALNDGCKLIPAATFKLAGRKSQNRSELFVFTYTRKQRAFLLPFIFT